MSEKRASKLEKEQQIQTIMLWIGNGLFSSEVIKQIMEVYGYQEAYAYKLYNQVLARIKERNLEDVEELRNKALNSLETIYRDAKADGDHNAALKAQAQIAKLIGSNAPERKDVTVTEVTPILKEIIDE